MAPISINISAPKAANYLPVSPYGLDDNALSNNLLCPRYADADTTSAPPSPSSIESFDIQDSVAWRRGFGIYNSHAAKGRAWDMWTKKKSQIGTIVFVFLLLVTSCSLGAFFAVRHDRATAKDMCYSRSGGERCEETGWAKCVSVNGVGYCEGIMGMEKDGV